MPERAGGEMAATIKVRVPEDTHVIICRGTVAGADHEIIHVDDLSVFLEAHILRHLASHFSPVKVRSFSWSNPGGWSLFLQGEIVIIVVDLCEGEPFSASIQKGDNSRSVSLRRIGENGK